MSRFTSIILLSGNATFKILRRFHLFTVQNDFIKRIYKRTAQRRMAIAMLLGGLLFTVYLATYTGVPLTDDERFYIDTTDTIAVRDFSLHNQTAYLGKLQREDIEPAQPLLAAPIYWLAYHTQWAGNLHALYLFAPLVTALTGVLLYAYALDLGYKTRTAVVGTLLFGLTTIVWPYTQTYFHEPLATFTLFGSAFLLARWRRGFTGSASRHWMYLAGGVLFALLTVLTKESMIIPLPALLLIAIPPLKEILRYRKQIALIGGVLLATTAVVFIVLLIVSPDLVADLTRYYNEQLNWAPAHVLNGFKNAGPGIAGYLASPGRSIWMFSPVLLAALAAPLLLPRGRWRESWLLLGLTVWYTAIYAAYTGHIWYGGANWGPRFTVPLTPFLMIAALPAIDRALSGEHKIASGIMGGLGALGFLVQLGGTYVYLFSYDRFLMANTGKAPFSPELVWMPRWSQAVGSFLYLPQADTNIRWFIDGTDRFMLGTLLALLLVLVGLLIWLFQQTDNHTLVSAVTVGVPLITVLVALLALQRAYDDPRYLAQREDLAQLRATLRERVAPDETIILSSASYVAHFMNYYKGEQPWFSLPTAPGERYSIDQEPEVISDDVNEMVGERGVNTIEEFTTGGVVYNGQPLWLVFDVSAAFPWSTRPMEWYLAANNYRVQAEDFSDNVRLVQFLSMDPPRPETPQHEVNAILGDDILLHGFDIMTEGMEADIDSLAPGAMLGLSLHWEAQEALGEDYTVAVFVIGPDGQPVRQQDTQPVGGYRPTSTWAVGERIIDNYGFILPEDAQAGRYQLWALMYSWPSLERLPVREEGSSAVDDHVLLTTFEVK